MESAAGGTGLARRTLVQKRLWVVLRYELRFQRLRVRQTGLNLRCHSRISLRNVGYHRLAVHVIRGVTRHHRQVDILILAFHYKLSFDPI